MAGGGGRRSDKEGISGLNLTSLTDILMTLIIMFIVMETSSEKMGFNMKLPNTVAIQTQDDPSILISLSAKGKLFVTTKKTGDEVVDPVSLKSKLRELRNNYGFDRIVVQADKSVKYMQVISIMDDAKQAGFQSISLATGI